MLVVRLQGEREIKPADNPPVPPPEKPFADAVSATGILEALSENVAIGVPQPGLVTKVNVKVNDKVKTGDVLFQLDDRDLQVQRMNAAAKRSVAQANVAVLEGQVEKINSQLTRLTSVKDSRAVSKDDIENLRNDRHRRAGAARSRSGRSPGGRYRGRKHRPAHRAPHRPRPA